MTAARNDTTLAVADPVAAAVRRAVEQAPPLSAEQRDRLRGLMNPVSARVPAPRESAERHVDRRASKART